MDTEPVFLSFTSLGTHILRRELWETVLWLLVLGSYLYQLPVSPWRLGEEVTREPWGMNGHSTPTPR